MSGPKSSYYTVTLEQKRKLTERRRREELERRRREEEERRRREEEERRHREELERQRREELERQRREELERRRREELERQRREELERQNRINQSDVVIDESFADFQSPMTSDLDKNFNDADLNPLIADLRIEYKIVCDMAGELEKSFDVSRASIQNIKAEITRLREKIAHDDEKAYISKCLDEVMKEMGYDVIGQREVTKKSGKHFKSELFSYADGTAVNVTIADNGHIAMELCGLDEVDRTPDLVESEKLCEHMETFCEDFSEIEQRLAEKGVILSGRIQRLPPSVEYAQILNISDYEISGAVEHFNCSRRRARTSQPLQWKN